MAACVSNVAAAPSERSAPNVTVDPGLNADVFTRYRASPFFPPVPLPSSDEPQEPASSMGKRARRREKREQLSFFLSLATC